MPISCHFRYCKALLSMCSSWSSAISSTGPLPFLPGRERWTDWLTEYNAQCGPLVRRPSNSAPRAGWPVAILSLHIVEPGAVIKSQCVYAFGWNKKTAFVTDPERLHHQQQQQFVFGAFSRANGGSQSSLVGRLFLSVWYLRLISASRRVGFSRKF